MRADRTPETFAGWWEKHGQPYEAAVIAGGGTPWPLDPDKRAATAEILGLAEDTDPMELRRALWERRTRRSVGRALPATSSPTSFRPAGRATEPNKPRPQTSSYGNRSIGGSNPARN